MSNYGIEAAKRRAKLNEEKRKEIQNKKPEPIKNKQVKAPNVDWEPMNNNKLNDKIYDYIDWNDSSTHEHSSYVTHQLFDECQDIQLIKMPAGSGKTAIAIESIGKLQNKIQEQIPFVVITTSQVANDLGWHRTIHWWNACHPNNQLHPIIITTVDKFKTLCRHDPSKRKLMKMMTKHSILVLDEVHKYKNPTGERAKQLQKFHPFKRIALTATPLTNNQIMDIISYLILGNFYKNKSDFMKKSNLNKFVGKWGKLNIFDEDGLVNTFIWPYYNKMMGEWGSMLYRPDIDMKSLDMPDIKQHIVQLDFNQSLDNDMRSLKSAKLNRMFESYTDYFMEAIKRMHEDDQRLNAITNIINKKDVIQPLIFYSNVVVRDAIINKLNKENINYQIIDGGTNSSDVMKDSDDPILIQYQSGSEGIELKHSNTSIFYQNQYSYATFKQAQGRNRRRGMKQDVHHYNIIADNPFDENIYNVIQNRGELSEKMIMEAFEKAMETY